MLATEYARLLQEGAPQSTINNTLNELYCALSALERLDKIATSRYNWQTSPPVIDPNIDGVSVRTDMWNDYKPSNFGLLNGNGILDTPVTCNNNHWPVVTEFEKNFYSNQHQNGKDLYRVFFSQDQLYHVLMGLYLTYRYIPDNLFYIDGDCSNGQYVNLREKAKSIALVYIDKVVDEGFFLVDPMNNNLQNEEGGQAHTFSMPLKSLSLLFNGPNYGVGGTDVYWYGSSGFFHEIATRHMSLVMCAITNESFDLSYSAATVIEQHADKVFTHYYFDDYEVRWGNFYRLLHNNLHGGSPLELNFYCAVEAELNSAPLINPQYIYGCGKLGWRSAERFIKEWDEVENGDQSGSFQGIYPGIDYMLLYNLYQLRQTWHYYDGSIHMGNNTVFRDYILSNAQILPNASVDYRASTKINLAPGFNSFLGSNFSAKITNSTCLGSVSRESGGFGNSVNASEPISDKFLGKEISVVVYPNPNNGNFTIDLKDSEQTAVVQVFDLMGKLVFTNQNVIGISSINIQDQPKGIYIVKTTIGGQQFNHKIVYN